MSSLNPQRRFGAEQLGWVVRNRRRPPPARPVADLAQQVLRTREQPRRLREVALAVHALVDDDFRRYCTIVDMRGGELRVEVSDPRMAAVLRLTWAHELPQALARRCAGAPIQRVRFTAARDHQRRGATTDFEESTE